MSMNVQDCLIRTLSYYVPLKSIVSIGLNYVANWLPWEFLQKAAATAGGRKEAVIVGKRHG